MEKKIAKHKKMATCIMLLVLLAPFFSYLHFTISRTIHRHHMWEMAERKSFVSITLIKHDIVWIKKGKEILVNGTFFDVKGISYSNDIAIVTGIFDHEEKALAKKFEREQQSNHHDSNVIAKFKGWWLLAYSGLEGNPINTFNTFRKNVFPVQPGRKPCGLRSIPLSPPPNTLAFINADFI